MRSWLGFIGLVLAALVVMLPIAYALPAASTLVFSIGTPVVVIGAGLGANYIKGHAGEAAPGGSAPTRARDGDIFGTRRADRAAESQFDEPAFTVFHDEVEDALRESTVTADPLLIGPIRRPFRVAMSIHPGKHPS